MSIETWNPPAHRAVSSLLEPVSLSAHRLPPTLPYMSTCSGKPWSILRSQLFGVIPLKVGLPSKPRFFSKGLSSQSVMKCVCICDRNSVTTLYSGSVGQSPQPTQNFWVYSEFLSFFVLYSRILADFLSQLGKWVKLIKFEAENEFFCTWKVEKPQSTTSTP